jgi:hypothetical protein
VAGLRPHGRLVQNEPAAGSIADGPGRDRPSRVVMNHYYAGEAATDPAVQHIRQALREEWKLVFEQDRPFVRGVHGACRRRDDAGVASCFSPFWDSAILEFQRSVVVGRLAFLAAPAT